MIVVAPINSRAISNNVHRGIDPVATKGGEMSRNAAEYQPSGTYPADKNHEDALEDLLTLKCGDGAAVTEKFIMAAN